MQQLDDGLWRLQEITNLQDFMKEREEAVKAKLAELNKPIARRLTPTLNLIKNCCKLLPYTIQPLSACLKPK